MKKTQRETSEHDPRRAGSQPVGKSRFGEITFMIRSLLLGLLLACGLSSCSQDIAPVAEAEYPAKIIGGWQGTVGDTRETITFSADGRFVSEVRPRGFISN